jgi:hypothetical protein
MQIERDDLLLLPVGEQHDSYQWHNLDKINNNPKIYKYTKRIYLL